MKLRPLFRLQDRRDSILAAGENSFGLAKINRSPVGQLIIDLVQDRANFLVLVGSQFHVTSPTVGGVGEPAKRIALTSHFVLGRTHDKKRACKCTCNKTCEHQKSDFPSTSGVHG